MLTKIGFDRKWRASAFDVGCRKATNEISARWHRRRQGMRIRQDPYFTYPGNNGSRGLDPSDYYALKASSGGCGAESTRGRNTLLDSVMRQESRAAFPIGLVVRALGPTRSTSCFWGSHQLEWSDVHRGAKRAGRSVRQSNEPIRGNR